VNDLGSKLQAAWLGIIEAESAIGAAQTAYLVSLVRFKHEQVQLITVLIGNVDLCLERLNEHAAHIAALEARLAALEGSK
jgi:hypothetical protein